MQLRMRVRNVHKRAGYRSVSTTWGSGQGEKPLNSEQLYYNNCDNDNVKAQGI